MPSKLSIHLSAYPSKAFDILEKMQPSVVKVFNQNSEMNIDEIRRRCGALIIYREYVDQDYHQSADDFYFKIKPSLDKLRGRGLVWEGINEPVPDSIQDAKLLNSWYVRFAQIMHSEGELVAGFSWSTGNPTPKPPRRWTCTRSTNITTSPSQGKIGDAIAVLKRRCPRPRASPW